MVKILIPCVQLGTIMPYRKTSSSPNQDTCSKTLTLPMQSWAQLYEIAQLRERTTKQALIIAIKSEWEFSKDKERHQALQQLELHRTKDNGVNKIPAEIQKISDIPQIES